MIIAHTVGRGFVKVGMAQSPQEARVVVEIYPNYHATTLDISPTMSCMAIRTPNTDSARANYLGGSLRRFSKKMSATPSGVPWRGRRKGENGGGSGGSDRLEPRAC